MTQTGDRRRGEAAPVEQRGRGNEQALDGAACSCSASLLLDKEGRYAAPPVGRPDLSWFSQNEALVFQLGGTEVEQQAALVASGGQVAQDLSLLGGSGSKAGLEFDDH